MMQKFLMIVFTLLYSYSKYFFKNFPVCDLSFFIICSGVPVATISPPLSPPSGPKSIIWSAVFIKSRLCSITTIVFPVSTSLCRISTNLWTSAIWSPVVGSSNIYNVFPVGLLESSVASFILCASPPDSVVEGCPKFNISKPYII